MKKAALTLLMLATFNYLYSANLKDMAKINDISGKTFGSFKVISYHSKNKYNDALWLCACIKCEQNKILMGSRISNGKGTTCYCGVHYNFKHGSQKIKEYRAYRHMLNRCYNPNVKEYPRYGGRGITVCDRWLQSYENFLADMGMSPSPKHSLDRIKVNGNYTPNNCRWATAIQQANNTRRTYMVDFKGNKIPLGLFCQEYQLPIELIRGRLNNGWSVERAMSTPNLRNS